MRHSGHPMTLSPGTVRGVAVVAVGDDLRHRRLRRAHRVEGLHRRRQLAPAVALRLGQGRDDLPPRRVDRQHLGGEELLARRPLRLGLQRRLLHVLGEALLDELDAQALAVRGLDLGDLVPQRLLGRVDGRVLLAVLLHAGPVEERVVDLDVAEDRRLHAVVVLLQDRVELVVVAPGAVHGHAEDAAAEGPQHVVEVVVPPLGVVLLAEVHARPRPQEPGGDEGLVGDVVELVARDLLAQELVVGLVVVEGVDDVVAVPPRVVAAVVLLEPRRVGVAGHVHPVTAPALAVVRRVEQPLDQALPGAPPGVGEELVDLLGGRRQPGEVQIGPAHQGQGVGPRPRRHPRLLAGGVEEAVDGVLVDLRGGHRGLLRQLERPVLARPVRQQGVLERGQGGVGARGPALVPVRAVVDPGADGHELGVAQRVAGHGHRGIVEAGQHPEEPAVLGAPRHEGRPADAALDRGLPRPQVQIRELRRLAVAVPAASLEDRPDVVGEGDLGPRLRLRAGAGTREEHPDQPEQRGRSPHRHFLQP